MKKILHNPLLYILLIAFGGIALLDTTLTEDRQIHGYSNDMRSVIRSDAAGYYVYLPAFFIYDFKANNFPDSIVEYSAYGYSLENGKVLSKYPFGVAIAYSPFFLVAHHLAVKKDGFSAEYHRAIRIAGVFYCTLGLIFCFLFFSKYVSRFCAFIALFPLFFSTNLMHYTLREPGYSHVLSFCLIASFLYFLSVFKHNPNHRIKWLLPVVAAFIIATRMLNGIVLLLIPFWDSSNFKSSMLFMKRLITDYKYLIFSVVILLIFLIPQLSYSLYLKGTGLSGLYANEHFTNIKNPQWKVVLFGAKNGLYIYTPAFLIFTICNLYAIQEKQQNAILILVLFSLVTFIYASWWNPTLGCSFGYRGFLDYVGLLIFPFVSTVDYFIKKKKWMLLTPMIVIVYFCCYLTQGINSFWWFCFYGKNDFDYFWLINDYFNAHHLKF